MEKGRIKVGGGEAQLRENEEEGRRPIVCKQVACQYTCLTEPHYFCFLTSLSFLRVCVLESLRSNSNWKLGCVYTYLSEYQSSVCMCVCAYMCICPSEIHVQSCYWLDMQTGTAAALVNVAKCGKW